MSTSATPSGNAAVVSAEKPMVIGVWMPLPPGTRLRGEGLMRLLDFISSGFPEANARIEIVTPPWMRDEFESEFKEMTPEQRAIYSLRTPRSLFSSIYEPINRFQMRRSSLEFKLAQLRNKRRPLIRPLLQRAGIELLKSPKLAFMLGGLINLAAFIFIVKEPVAALSVFGALLSVAFAALIVAMVKASSRTGGLLGRLFGSVRKFFVQPWKTVKTVAEKLMLNAIAVKDRMLDADLRLQAAIASRQYNVDCWFTMHVTSDSARYLKGPIVALFADFVFLDCPATGSRDWLRRAKIRTRRLIKRVDGVITLAEHVRDNQLYRYFPAARKAHVAVIDHAPIDLRPDLPAVLADGFPRKTENSRKSCGDAIRKHIRSSLSKEVFRREFRMPSYSRIYENQYRYLDGFPLEDVRYIFVSTQIRPYKNILNLVKAVEILLRQRGMAIKLIISGNFQPGQDVYDYICEKGLHYDVWSIPRLPRPAHAAMYHCAELTVHPTFFEGGQGAFPLSESLSVGTPVLLSRHPGTLADADSALYHEMLFDPYSVEEMADRIEEALRCSDALVQKQYDIFTERMAWRSWADVSREYIEVFRIAQEKARERKQ